MKKAAIVLLLLTGCLLFGQSANPKKIPMVFGDYPPFYIAQKDSAGKTIGYIGMYMDFLAEFQKDYPYQIVVVSDLPRLRMDKALESGEALAFSLNNPMFSKNAADYLWSDSIFYTKDVVISPKDKPVKYEKPEDLFGKRIAKPLGNGYGELDKYFASNQIIANDLHGEASEVYFKMMDMGRVDAMFGNISVVTYQMKQLGIYQQKYYWAEKPLFEFDLMCQIVKTETKFQTDLNNFIAKAKKSGLITKIEDKWLH